MIRRGLAVLAIVASMAGCAPSPDGTRTAIAPGGHKVSIVSPKGWEVVDQGREVLLRRGEARLSLRDLGPVGGEGLRREIERARELWLRGQEKDARWSLRAMPVPDAMFRSRAQRSNYWTTLQRVSEAPPGVAFVEVRAAFDVLLDSVAALSDPPFPEIVAGALNGAGVEDPGRREPVMRGRIQVDGHDGVLFDTWYRVTHTDRRRYAVLRNDTRLLSLATDGLRPELAMETFDRVLRSLRFEPGEGLVTRSP